MKALIIIDMQRDFMPGGNEIIPIINALTPHFAHVIATQNLKSAQFANGLVIDRIEAIFHTGEDFLIDSALVDYLQKHEITHLYFVGGSINDSVLNALELGFQATVIVDACLATDLKPGDEEKMLEEMKARGAKLAISKDFIPVM